MQSNTVGELSEILFGIIMSLRCQYIAVLWHSYFNENNIELRN
jgi:hypothetical protein